LLAFFSSFAGDGGCHRRRGREEEKRLSQIPLFSSCLRRRVNPRAASGGGAWEDAPPLFQRPETFQPLFLQIPKGFPAVSCYFLGVGSVILGC